MEWIREWWEYILSAGAIVSGIVIAIGRLVFRIRSIEQQLAEGGKLFNENRKEHKEIQSCLRKVGESQARTETDIKWLVRRQKNGDK